jgi:hypothetical protein
LAIITDSPLPDWDVGVDYTATVEATGCADSSTWSIDSGDFPAWAYLDPDTGVITGTPDAEGTFDFTVKVECGACSDTQELSITINPVLSITTDSLPCGQVKVNYLQTLQASGGTEPYSWSKFSGDLPPGLNLSTDGVISGKPTAKGTYDFTVQVEDAAHATATKDLSIVIGLEVTAPNGGEEWIVGEVHDITWTSACLGCSKVKIQLSRDGGKHWKTIISSTPNDGSEPWKVTCPCLATDQARIKIVSTCDKYTFDISDADFTIHQ